MIKPIIQLDGELLNTLQIKENIEGTTAHTVVEVPNAKNRELTISYFIPIIDIQYMWHPTADGNFALINEGDSEIKCRLNRSMPVLSLFDSNNINHFSLAIKDLISDVMLVVGVHEESASIKVEAIIKIPNNYYNVAFTVDFDLVCWSKAIQDQVKGLYSYFNISPKIVPAVALDPVLSTWYSFHQNVEADSVYKEAQNYNKLGAKTLILDDGWQTVDSQRRYAYTGDWEVSISKFPDFKEHINKVKKLGMKYMIWLSLPYVGSKSQHWPEFQDKLLRFDEFQRAGILDIREKTVQIYLLDIVTKVINRYPVDGLKLDFLDTFFSEEGSNNDVSYSLINFLEELEKLYSKKRDFLIEFRQDYINPLMMKYCNIIRAKDCPNSYCMNRIRTVDLRLSCPYTAVHSDMIMWNEKEEVESAALQLINVLFVVPQISVNSARMSDKEMKMLKFWLDFHKENRDILFSEDFVPLFPQEGYSQIHLHHEQRGIIFNYSEGKIVQLRKPVKELIIINGTLQETMVIDMVKGNYHIIVKDCIGNIISEKIAQMKVNKLVQYNIPRSGLINIISVDG